jgi:hypothetical protein
MRRDPDLGFPRRWRPWQVGLYGLFGFGAGILYAFIALGAHW